MLGGRKLAAPLARRSGAFQMAMGAIMVLVAFAMWQNYDTKFQSNVAADLPSFLVNPAEGIEKSGSAQDALAEIRGGSGHGIGLGQKASKPNAASEARTAKPAGVRSEGADRTGNSKRAGQSQLTAEEEETVPLDDIGTAPEFTDTEDWFNTPGDKPLTMKGLRGKVVLIDFWTYSCINCIRTLPYLNAWNKRYAKDGLVIVGVHTPEFPFEREASNVEEAIKTEGIEYPVVQDNEKGTWNAYGNLYWPAEYFVDANGPGPLRRLRRGRIRQERTGDPRAADRSRAPAGQGTLRRPRDGRRTDRDDAGVLPRLRPRRELHQRPDHARARTTSRSQPPRPKTNSPTAANGRSPNSR